MKTRRKKKQFGKLLALVFVLSVACFYGVRGYLIKTADAVIDQMISEAEQEFGDDEEAKVIALTSSFYKSFDEDAPGAYVEELKKITHLGNYIHLLRRPRAIHKWT